MKCAELAPELKVEYKKQPKHSLVTKLLEQLVDNIKKEQLADSSKAGGQHGAGVPPAACSEAGGQPASEDNFLLIPDEHVEPPDVGAGKVVDVTWSQFAVGEEHQVETDDNALMLVPEFVVAKFKVFAERNFLDGIESLGMLFGKKTFLAKYKRELWVVECLFLPLQTGTKDTCQVSPSHKGERVVEVCEKSKLQLVGWIHTHPTYDAFLSSVDQHMQYAYQREMEHCVAAVVSKDGITKFFRLTDAGMDFNASCKGVGPDGFHEHPGGMFEEVVVVKDKRRRGVVIDEEAVENDPAALIDARMDKALSRRLSQSSFGDEEVASDRDEGLPCVLHQSRAKNPRLRIMVGCKCKQAESTTQQDATLPSADHGTDLPGDAKNSVGEDMLSGHQGSDPPTDARDIGAAADVPCTGPSEAADAETSSRNKERDEDVIENKRTSKGLMRLLPKHVSY